MINIEIISSESGGVIQSTNNSVVSLNQSSIVKINLNIDEVASISRQGNAAVITLKNGETITLENYFNYPIETSQILFENEGELIWAQFTDATGAVLDSVNYIPLSNIAPLAGETVAGAAISPWLIGAGLAAGLGVAIAAVQDDSGSKNTKDTTAPDAWCPDSARHLSDARTPTSARNAPMGGRRKPSRQRSSPWTDW